MPHWGLSRDPGCEMIACSLYDLVSPTWQHTADCCWLYPFLMLGRAWNGLSGADVSWAIPDLAFCSTTDNFKAQTYCRTRSDLFFISWIEPIGVSLTAKRKTTTSSWFLTLWSWEWAWAFLLTFRFKKECKKFHVWLSPREFVNEGFQWRSNSNERCGGCFSKPEDALLWRLINNLYWSDQTPLQLAANCMCFRITGAFCRWGIDRRLKHMKGAKVDSVPWKLTTKHWLALKALWRSVHVQVMV